LPAAETDGWGGEKRADALRFRVEARSRMTSALSPATKADVCGHFIQSFQTGVCENEGLDEHALTVRNTAKMLVDAYRYERCLFVRARARDALRPKPSLWRSLKWNERSDLSAVDAQCWVVRKEAGKDIVTR
jgi:hypothetical protein